MSQHLLTAKHYADLSRALLKVPQRKRKALPTKTRKSFIARKAGGRRFLESYFSLSRWGIIEKVCGE